MDPLMVQSGRWVWEVNGAYFGVPVHNFIGWWATTFVTFGLFLLLFPAQKEVPAQASQTDWERWAYLSYFVTGASNAAAAALSGLGGPALVGVFSMNLDVLNGTTPVKLLSGDARLTYSFKLTDEQARQSLAVYFWDETAQEGKGDWVLLPDYQEENDTPVVSRLYPDKTDELRTIYSGVKQTEDTHFVTFATNFTGLFLFVTK